MKTVMKMKMMIAMVMVVMVIMKLLRSWDWKKLKVIRKVA
jgi:hypothetical protein